MGSIAPEIVKPDITFRLNFFVIVSVGIPGMFETISKMLPISEPSVISGAPLLIS
jgi:hypothetical protein